MCGGSPEGQWNLRLHREMCPAGQGSWFSPSPLMKSHFCPVLRPQYKKGAQQWLESWSISPVKKGQESWVFLFREEKAPRTPHCRLSVHKGDLYRRLFTKACSDRIWGNGFKLKEGIFRLDTNKAFFTREVVDVPLLEMFKVRLDGA